MNIFTGSLFSLKTFSSNRKSTQNKQTLFMRWILAFMLCAGVGANAQTTLINPATDGGFESGFGTFTVVNGTTGNKWFTGTAAGASAGTNAAFIGSSATTYTDGVSQSVSVATSIYKDITFPAGQTVITLTFDYKQPTLDGTYDLLRVFLVPTTTTITAGTALTTGQISSDAQGQGGQATFGARGITIAAANAGTTQRLVFQWKNDAVTPYGSGAIDKISLTSAAPAPISGTYTIDNTLATGGTNFASFTAAINYLNINGTNGPLTLNVTAGQTFTESLPALSFTGSAANPIIFQKNGAAANPVIVSTGSTGTEAAVLINGSDYLTFDGINITASGTALEYGYYLQNASATNGAQNNTIKNCAVTLNKANTLSIGIYQVATTTTPPTAATGANSNNKYYNLLIKNNNGGILLNGNTAFPDLNCEIGTTSCATRNTIGDPAVADDILANGVAGSLAYGIRVINQGSFKIFNNDISSVSSALNNSVVEGIFVDNSAATVALGTSDVYNNKISGITNTGAGTNTATFVRGIRANGNTVAGTITRIYNNFISNLQTGNLATTGRRIQGISLQQSTGGAGSAIYCEFNSVRIAATNLTPSNTCFEIATSSGPVFRVRDNIFANLTAAQTGTAKHYTWVTTSASSVGSSGSVSNYNDLYVTGTNGFVGLGNATDYATLANWQAGVGQDANSVSTDPQFTSATDLHSSAVALNGTADPSYATNTPYVTTDIDCTTRPAATDIGADEFTVSGCSSATGGTASGTTSFCGSGTPTITATGYTTGLNTTYQWEYSNDNFVADVHDFVGQTTPNALTTGVVTTTTYYRLRVTCTTVPVTGYSNIVTVTINTVPTVAVTPTTANFCSPGGTAVTLTASGASTYTWTPTAGLTPTTGAVVSASPAATTTYTVTGTAANGCTNTATATVTVLGNPTVTATATPATICSGFTATLNGSAFVSSTANNYSFSTGTGATLDPMTGAATVVGAYDDDYPMCTSGTSSTTCSASGAAIALPFTFNFDKTNYTFFSASPDGWLSFANSATAAAGSSSSYTNAIASSTNAPKIAPYWDDLATGTTGNIKTVVTGTSPNRIFKIQWFVTIPRATTSAANSTYQAWLYESSNKIEFRYGTLGTDAAGGASGGLTGSTGTNFQSITFSGNTSTSAAANDGNTTQPASGRIYTYTPAPAGLTYAWSPAGDVVSPTAQSTVTNPLTATETFTFTATNGTCSATATATVTVSAGAAITTDPVAQAKCAGQTATFTVVATGPSLTYQWRKNGTAIPVGSNASAGTATLTLSNVTAADAATYDVVVSSTCGAPATSAGAALTVTTPLAGISTTPATTVCSGTSVTLTENGGTATSWSWAPDGQTTQSITVTPAVTTTYTVTATVNGCSATASQIITVNPTPSAITITPASPTICEGSSQTLTASGGSVPVPATVNVGTATTLNATTSYPAPYTNYYGGAKHQMLIRASELTALGLSAGSNITSVSFSVDAVGSTFSGSLQNFRVDIGATSSTVLTSTAFIGGLTNVVAPATKAIPTTGLPQFVSHVFSAPFVWNGTSNIVIQTSYSNANSGASTDYVQMKQSDPGFVSTNWYRTDGATAAVIFAAATPTSSGNARPNMIIGYLGNSTPTYTWSAGTTPSTGATVSVTPSATTTYTATSTVNGCSSSGSATVTVNPNYTITASAGTNGSISPNGVTTLTCNGTGSQTYTITPDAGYHIADVLVDGVSNAAAIAAGTYTFTNVTANHTISASFAINTYTITASAGANGSIAPNGVTTVNSGANQTYTITPDAGYHIADVLVDGVSNAAAIAAGTYTFTNVTANHTISASFAINTYTITASAGANGSVAPNGVTTVNSGANQTYTITPDAGYSIADVLVDGVSNAAAIASGSYTFTNVTANHTISASFAINTYTITASAGANGSIAPNGVTTVNSGANQTYTITPDAGYHIADVLVDGVSNAAAIAAGTYTFTNVTANHTISASFAINTYTITASAGANGSIAPNGVTTVNSGANQTYTITPDAGYSIADVLVDGVSNAAAIAAGTYTFTNVTANHTISASFTINGYTITASAGANGSISPNGITNVNSGGSQTYTITPNACYSIANVLVDGVSNAAAIASGTYTFTNVTANHTISATFVLNTYTITVTDGANGTITPGTGTVNCGANATYTITPDACYAIATLIVDGASVTPAGTYTFTNVTANHTITATYSLTTYTINASAGAGGTITPAGASTVNCGDDATYTITPNTCFSILNVVVDGISQGPIATYTFNTVGGNHTISATFSLNTYTITATSGTNGTVTPVGTSTINCGDNATYTITPAACYAIADVLVDGVSNAAAIASGTYTFTNVTANHTISATFVQTTYTITATSGANGTVTPAGASTVNCGDNATYTITPAACYAIADVLVDGVSNAAAIASGTYTFNNVTANHTISATFVQLTYTITATSGANGTVTPAGASTVNCGDDATYTITPAACYAIADVLVDGVSNAAAIASGTYTFNNVTANHTISATFVQTTYTITATSGANGMVTPAGASTINCGDNATYTITPAACYAIADVLVDGVSNAAAIASGTYTFNNVTANHTISATFVQTTYTITATSGANGTVTPAGASTINCGDNATYTITPAACYAIADVLVDGVSNAAAIASGTYTFNNVTANHTISATFVQTTYTITATSGANGTVTPAGASTVNCGDNATYTITPAACYAIADVLVDGVSNAAAIASGTYTFNNVTANHTISATFVQTTYTITATSGANGTVTPAGASTINCGDNATYTITPAACYAIADVLVDGVSNAAAIASGTYTFNNVTANHTISATFVQTTYTITATSGANGTVTPAGASTINCGDNATYTITPAACYAIADVLVDGVSNAAAIASGTYTFNNVTANHTISATFVQTTYTITATSGANGTVTPAGASTINCGDNATYTITPAACYAIADVLVDGVSNAAAIASGTYTFTNVTANHTISATFVQTTYIITATSGANGTVTPAGTSTVNCGSNATYTITPAACYAIATLVVDGVSVTPAATYTFTNVTANHTISATFVQTTYTITATSGANGTVTPAGTSTVNCGSNATYTITPAACYAIATLVVDGVSVTPAATYTFTNVTANHTISATFVQLTYTITATSGANGTVTPAGTSTVNCGSNATYTITANGGYAIQNVIVDGVSQGAVGTYTFTNVTANHTISATFVAVGNNYTITASAGTNGSIAPNGVTTVASGGSQSYTITPAACYHVADVLVDGTSAGAVTSYTFTNVTSNHTISATFAINGPAATPVVTGFQNVCPYINNGQVTYTASSQGATGFTWVTPPNVTIVTGQGTANLTVTFQSGFVNQVNKQLRVTATSPCGNSMQVIYYLAAAAPSTPQPITASSSDVCPIIGTAGTITYKIPSVVGATSYLWSNPAGTNISHPNGTGINDTLITLSFTNAFATSALTVRAANDSCGASGLRSLTITRANPSQPGLISGPTNACPYMAPGGTAASYSIAPVTGATSYTWTAPGGAVITGQGTTMISFTYPSSFTSGSVTVTATNGCGTSTIRSLAISKLLPAAPSAIDVIALAPCPDRVYSYTLSAMPANSTSVQWTVPAGGTITSGQGTTSITVSYSTAAINGNITAQALSNCGSSSIRVSTVKLPSCAIERPAYTQMKGGVVEAKTMSVNVYPNPSVSDFNLQVLTAGKEAINVRILDLQGREYRHFTVQPNQTTTLGSDLKAGAYMMEVKQGAEVKTTRLIKF